MSLKIDCASSQEVFKMWDYQIILKITFIKLLLHSPRDNELNTDGKPYRTYKSLYLIPLGFTLILCYLLSVEYDLPAYLDLQFINIDSLTCDKDR